MTSWRKARPAGIVALAAAAIVSCAPERSPASYDFIWSGVSVQDEQAGNRFTDRQAETIAQNAAYVFFSEFHGGWDHYASLADARRLKSLNPELRVCLYWKPSTIVARSLDAPGLDRLLRGDEKMPARQTTPPGGNPYVRETFERALRENAGSAGSFVLRDVNGEPISPYNNRHVYFLDVRHPAQREWVVDAVSGLLQADESPFDCVGLDSMNMIGGGNPTTADGEPLCPEADDSFLDFERVTVRRRHSNVELSSACRMRWFWQARLGREQYSATVAAYNAGLLSILRALRDANPGKEVFFNGVSDKVWRFERNLALLGERPGEGAHGALDEDFCIDYRRGRSRAEKSTGKAISGLRAYKPEEEVRADWELMEDAAADGKKLFLKTNLAREKDLGNFALGMAKEFPQISPVNDQRIFCHAQFLAGAQLLATAPGVWATYYKFGNRYRTPLELEHGGDNDAARQSLFPAASGYRLGAPVGASVRALGGGLYCRAYEFGTVFVYFSRKPGATADFGHPGVPVEATRWTGHEDGRHTLQPFGAAIFVQEDAATHGDCGTNGA